MPGALKFTLLLILICFSIFTMAQQRISINYPDQKPPGSVAQIFAPGLVSTTALEHSSPAFSPDGTTIFWTIMKMPSYQTCLLQMDFSNGKWSNPHIPSFSDTSVNEVYPHFSINGDTLFFSSDRKTDTSSTRKNTLWYVVKSKTGWSEANPLGLSTYKQDVYASSVSENGSRYFIIGLHGTSDWNIFTRNHTGKVTALPSYINTNGYEDGAFIARDESYLIFESDRATDKKGFIDLYISFKKNDGSWAEPMNMGDRINTQFAERFASVSPDGKYLFFGRNTGKGFDIYWIDSLIIQELKSQWLQATNN
jgi:Tol biopolymer transport system component